MKKRLILLFVFSFSLFVTSYSNEHKGTAGIMAETNSGVSIKSSRMEYPVQLLPGQSFSGWYYYWSNSGAISANLQISPAVNWLIITPSSFTSNGCSDIKAVNYTFIAPAAPGTYSTSIIDLNNNWEATNVTLTVTNSPTLNRYDSTVSAPSGQTANRYHVSSYMPITNLGCNYNYFPGSQCQTIHTLHPAVTWLNINPNNFLVNQNSSVTAVKSFNYNTAGIYHTLECRTKQWFSNPVYIYWTFNVGAISVQNLGQEIPEEYSLSQNYPNPFNPKTIINFQLPMSNDVKLIVYDVLGKEVAVLVNEQLKPGTYEVEWNASDYPSGVYFYKLTTGDFVETKKMMLVK
ncbi:MAG: T9SS C-terminal target domain-containing protein [Ignavibacteriae bacterium]|nr:MAG: T9SS C-terminal target domain-containing protein [Ignavibacteriota bacterium]